MEVAERRMSENPGINMCKSEMLPICFAPKKVTPNGIWQGDNPLIFPLRGFVIQVCVIIIFTRVLVFLFKPLRQPKVISEILGGILLGPAVVGRWKWYQKLVFPDKSIPFLETMANIGLLYFIFLVGVQMDITVLKRTGKKAFLIAICGMAVTFCIGAFFGTRMHVNFNVCHESFCFFVGAAVSVTAFPVLTRILAALKLLNTDLGRMAMSSAFINDVFAWVVLAIAISFTKSRDYPIMASAGVILMTIVFVLVWVFLVRPLVHWGVHRTPEGQNYCDLFLAFILTGVLLSAFITDIIGTHPLLGAFIYGLIIPNDQLRASLIERLEDFITELLLPLFFAIIGLKTDFACVVGNQWGTLLVLSILAGFAKIGTTVFLSMLFRMPFCEGLSLGLLMNTKGLMEMVVLNIGKEMNVLDDETFGVLVIVSVVMTCIVTPTVMLIYKPARSFGLYKKRTIQKLKPDSELRMLACVHTSRNVPSIINFLEASHPTKKLPVYVYALHLVELTDRESAILIFHNTQKASGAANAKSEHIFKAFENYEQHAGGVSVRPLTAVSVYSTMHEDICNIAEEKRVSFIILPFHKQQTVDGSMETQHPAYRSINKNVLANAPCSVGILLDRGLRGSTRSAASQISHHVVVLFFGGPDDREALAYAMRMAHNSCISLTVTHFVPGEEAKKAMVSQNDASKDQNVSPKVVTENEKERQRDKEYINGFRMKAAQNASMVYTERVVENAEHMVALIRFIDSNYDLYVVGKGQGTSPLTATLTDWSECPELGVIGDFLASSDFGSTASVLVVQQYAGLVMNDGLATPDRARGHTNLYTDIINKPGSITPLSETSSTVHDNVSITQISETSPSVHDKLVN